MLPAGIPAKEIAVDAYLREWQEYGSREELKSIFTAADRLLGFSVMYFLKYVRTRDMYLRYDGKTGALSANGGVLEKRCQSFTFYLKKFINDDFYDI